jgi:MFS transporter, ACS family, D-galactonate transporter
VTESSATAAAVDRPRPSPVSRLWQRQLDRYPANGPRSFYLGIVVIATVLLYYELYIPGAVATNIIAYFGASLKYFIVISIIGNAVGALASLAAGLADRWGRANLVVIGLFITGALTCFVLPNTSSKGAYLIVFALISLVEGVILVATPALIRDFSPQLGRASAMGFWTLGPVVGSLVVTEVSSHTLPSHPDWQFQFRLCGGIGLLVAVIALVGLRELSPKLRDQLMVSLRDRALVEARAAGIDERKLLHGSWRQMMSFDVVGPAFGISVFLLFYYIAVGFFVIYFALTYGYTPARANGLANWYWATNAIALVVVGVISDKVRVRKPFMVIGSVVSAVGVAIFASLATKPDTSYYTFAWLFVLIAAGGGVAYCAWMAAYTETVERHNPAATATGLAVWGAIIRTVVTLSLLVFLLAVSSAGVLVDYGAKTGVLATKYSAELSTLGTLSPATQSALASNADDPAVQAEAISEISGVPAGDVTTVITTSTKFKDELATLQAIDPATAATLSTNPTDGPAIGKAIGEIATAFKIDANAATQRLIAAASVPKPALATLQADGVKVQQAGDKLTAIGRVPKDDLAFLAAHGTAVQQAQIDSPREWKRWWWVCFAGQIVFLPFIFVLTGRWSPRKAAEDARAHEEAVVRELEALRREQTGAGAGAPA